MKNVASLYALNVRKIKVLLAEHDWNRSDLARKLRVSPAIISHIMMGRRSGRRLAPRIAHALGVHLEDILLKPQVSVDAPPIEPEQISA